MTRYILLAIFILSGCQKGIEFGPPKYLHDYCLELATLMDGPKPSFKIFDETCVIEGPYAGSDGRYRYTVTLDYNQTVAAFRVLSQKDFWDKVKKKSNEQKRPSQRTGS